MRRHRVLDLITDRSRWERCSAVSSLSLPKRFSREGGLLDDLVETIAASASSSPPPRRFVGVHGLDQPPGRAPTMPFRRLLMRLSDRAGSGRERGDRQGTLKGQTRKCNRRTPPAAEQSPARAANARAPAPPAGRASSNKGVTRRIERPDQLQSSATAPPAGEGRHSDDVGPASMRIGSPTATPTPARSGCRGRGLEEFRLLVLSRRRVSQYSCRLVPRWRPSSQPTLADIEDLLGFDQARGR